MKTVIEAISEVCCKYTSMGYQYANSITNKKETNARQCYKIPDWENIITLIDGTLIGSAKNGIAICTRGVYWSNSWMTKTNLTYVSWEDYINCNVKKKDDNIDLGNGGVISTLGYFDDHLKLFKELQIAIKTCISQQQLENEKQKSNETVQRTSRCTPPPFPPNFRK
ncbi:hypothetical protein [Clostridium saccharobutylicum]|uniref:Uncharacterized protein n=1 Tax=Clostridium saccharobutylicum TaxID=169679 RepID=A0A1S8N3Y7_CLOSA|nr:hypothetical protein [Clostridium saccharobutylicum]OOM11147.1 hypothetical protein CLOSAC_26900 [Clostridium saccharobutylicum]